VFSLFNTQNNVAPFELFMGSRLLLSRGTTIHQTTRKYAVPSFRITYIWADLKKPFVMNQAPQKSVFTSALIAGLIYGGILIGMNLLFMLLGLDQNVWAGLLGFIVTCTLLWYFQKTHRDKQLGGYITYGKAYGFGILTVINMSLVTAIFTFLYFTIDTGAFDDLVYMNLEKLEESKDMISPEQLQGQVGFWKGVTPFYMALLSIIGQVFGYALVNLITSAIAKRTPN